MRTRDLKAGFFTCPELLELPFETRLLFAGLWCCADREGRLEDRAGRVALEIFPKDSVDVDAMIDQLAENGFIDRYQVDGENFIQVLNFVKHQHIHHREAPSKIPPPPGASPGQTRGQPEASPVRQSDSQTVEHSGPSDIQTDTTGKPGDDGWDDSEVAEGMKGGKLGYSKRR